MTLQNKTYNKKVNFLITGVQKGGTTILDQYLRHHPDVCMADRKEVHFFDNERLFNKNNTPDYALYHNNFSPDNEQQILGESTPIYSYWKPSTKRIWEYNPDIKLILLLRNPIERAYSHWNKETINFHSYSDSQTEAVETLSFYDAITQETERAKNALPLQHRYFSYLDRGIYSEQIKRLLNHFPTDQLLILKSDWLRNNTQETVDTVYDFLNIARQDLPKISSKKRTAESVDKQSPVDLPQQNLHNISHYKAPISDRAKAYLQHYFKAEIAELESLLDWDCSDWMK